MDAATSRGNDPHTNSSSANLLLDSGYGMCMANLNDDTDDSFKLDIDNDSDKIEINEDFAKRFEHNKKREFLQKYNELRKRGFISDSEDSDESSDESSGVVPVQDDLEFYNALVRVKKNDSTILQKDAKLFSSSEDDEEDPEKKPKATQKVKPLYLKDVNARQLMEDGSEIEEEPLKENRMMYNREQVESLKAFLEEEKKVFGSDDDGDVIVEQKKMNNEDAEKDENAVKVQQKVNEFFGEDANLSDGEMFLKQYCLHKMWIDKEKDKKLGDDIRFSDDEEELEKQEKFEAEYNFRHEEGQDDRVLGHSRITKGSVRKRSSNRKTQRKTKEERMKQAEFERKEELKHLKNLKKKEIQEKLERIRVNAGIGEGNTCNAHVTHLEGDFDPEEYDKAMKEIFDVDYYNAEDVDPDFGSDDGDDVKKPDFDEEDKLLGLTDGWNSIDTMDGFECMRKTLLEKKEVEEPSHLEGKQKRKQRIDLREKVELDKELEEYYRLDYEGTVGDLKTRFKYRFVTADSYGLHTEEILMASDKDLNQYVSLKNIAPYREKEWKVTYHQKLKKKLILQGVKFDRKISSGKTRTGRIKNEADENKLIESNEVTGDRNVLSKRSRKRQKHAQLKLSTSRLIAYGKIPSRIHKRH